MRTCLSLTCLTLIALTSHAAEPDWPSWRGPKRDNLSPDTGLLKEWPKDGPAVLWKTAGIGSGYSSMTISGNRIFTIGNKNKLSNLVCLDRKDGKVQWSAEVGPQGGNLGCTPTIDGDRAYAVGQGGDLVCVDVEKGEVKWRKHFKKDFGGNCGGWNYTESPLIDGDRLICTPGAKDAIMVALDKRTGEVIWKCEAPVKNATAGYASIVIAEVNGIKMYVQTVAAGVIGVAAKDGKFLWHYEKLGNNTANCPTPVVLGSQIFATVGYGGKGGSLLSLTVDNGKVSVKEEYYKPELKNKHGGVIVVGDRVFGDTDDSGSPFCADWKSGKQIWKKKERTGGSGSVAMAYADDRLYCLYQNGFLALVDATANEYKEVGSFKVPGEGNAWAHPVILGGKMYVRHGDTMLCYDVKQK